MAQLTKDTLKYMGAIKDTVLPSPKMLKEASTDMNSVIIDCVKTLEDLADKYQGLFDTIVESDMFDTDFNETLKNYKEAVRTLRMAGGSFGYGLVKAASELSARSGEAVPGSQDTNPRGGWSND